MTITPAQLREQYVKSGRPVPAALGKPVRSRPIGAEWWDRMAALPGVFVPVKTVNELNDHSHWRVRQKRAKGQHQAVAACLHGVPRPALPVVVQFTRYSPGTTPLDDDGAVAAVKHVRDAVAKWLGVDDADERVKWIMPPRQVTCQPAYGVRLEFSTPGMGGKVE
jgi:hypothetical protein